MVRRIVRADRIVVVLLVVITVLFGWQYVERHQRLSEDRRRTVENHRLNCAIQRYIEAQFKITASTKQQPQVIARRLGVIAAFEKAVDGSCVGYKLPR